ncbi:MAG: hypothetical protein V2B15_08845 [Bacteroidota bacterium]
MKKTLAILALVLFMGGISATAVAATVDSKVTIVAAEDEKKTEETKSESKDCEAKKETTAKSSDCSKGEEKKCEGEKK